MIFIGCPADADTGQQLAVLLQHRLARAGVKVHRADDPLSLQGGQRQLGIQSQQGRDAVGADGAVAQIAADGGHMADLGTANLIARICQHGNAAARQRIGVNGVKAGAGADQQIAVAVQTDALQLRHFHNADEGGLTELALLHMDHHIRAAANHNGAGMRL